MPQKDNAATAARDRALEIIIACYHGEEFGHRLLAERQVKKPLAPRDAALAAELVTGVNRHRITAEHLAARFYRGRWAGVPISTQVIISLAVYQLCWLDRVPDHAVIDQAARQARRRGRHAVATVNALLRRIQGICGEVIERPDHHEPRRFLPIDDALAGRFGPTLASVPRGRPSAEP